MLHQTVTLATAIFLHIFFVKGHRVRRYWVRVGLGVVLVTLGLETGFGRGLGIGLVSYKPIFRGKKS